MVARKEERALGKNAREAKRKRRKKMHDGKDIYTTELEARYAALRLLEVRGRLVIPVSSGTCPPTGTSATR